MEGNIKILVLKRNIRYIEIEFTYHKVHPKGIIQWFLVCALFCANISWVQFSRSVMSNSLRPHGLQHARLPCPSLSPCVCLSSYPLSWWCHPTISSSVVPFSCCLQSFPAPGSFPISFVTFLICLFDKYLSPGAILAVGGTTVKLAARRPGQREP